MIPPFLYRDGTPYGVLPPGVHHATLDEIEARYAITPHRARLFAGIVQVAAALRHAGCRPMLLDGSFVTDKEAPEDFDGCWDPRGVNASERDPVLLEFTNRRAAQKAKYGGEMFVASWPATSSADVTFLEFFQTDKHIGEKKGIVAIDLGEVE